MVEIVVATIGGAVLLFNTWLAQKTVKNQRTANGHTMGQLSELSYYRIEKMDDKLDTHINDDTKHV